ncbi:Flp pilus assembly protein CpaB [Gemmatimonas sp. UBA7669]|uniref:Flp pilus assembly protein CpaB n=1 Tax=Gemmatimonas sp. UBA7669 TaxID=1946568 RepID=UPI0025C707E4|nr:Flp pilus assembly protein CpaB [Gemmatimonas sp. UBA7669]
MFGDRRYRFVLYIALMVAGLATFGVYRVIDGMRASSRIATQNVVVAAADIPEGQALTQVDLAVVQLPVAAVPAGSYGAPTDVVGRVSRIPIFKGEAIVPGRLAPEGTAGGLEVKILPGKRAMSVRIDDVAGLSGMVQPNSRVDVMLTTRDAVAGGQISKLFMSNMRVLSVGAQVTRGEDGRPINAPTATLEVTPEEAERLALATREGSIQLVLRGYGDPDSIKTTGAVKGDLLTQVAVPAAPQLPEKRPAPRRSTPVPAPQPAPQPTTITVPPKTDSVVVKVYRGDQLSQLKFEQARDSARRDSIRRAQRDTLR